jgi:hypothetical protein
MHPSLRMRRLRVDIGKCDFSIRKTSTHGAWRFRYTSDTDLLVAEFLTACPLVVVCRAVLFFIVKFIFAG